MFQTYAFLILAVIAETIGTTALQASHQFTKVGPSLVVCVAYAVAFYLLSLTLRSMPVGVIYAMWSGLGIVFISAIGWVLFNQKLDVPAIAGIVMILAGIIIIQLFSNVSTH